MDVTTNFCIIGMLRAFFRNLGPTRPPCYFLKYTAIVGIHGGRCAGEPRSSCHLGRRQLLELLEFKREILAAQ